MMYHISACSEFHYFMNFIWGLRWICGLTNETWVWNSLMWSKGLKTCIKLTRKKRQVSMIWSKWQMFWVSLGHTDLWKLFHKLQCLEHFNIVDVPEHYNHTLLDIVWSELSLTELLLLFRVISWNRQTLTSI